MILKTLNIILWITIVGLLLFYFIQVPKYQNIMYLPIRYKKCQIYPYNTTLQGYWTTHEIKQAKKYGYKIIKLHESITYDTLPTNPFKKYLEMLYQQRRKSNANNKKPSPKQ